MSSNDDKDERSAISYRIRQQIQRMYQKGAVAQSSSSDAESPPRRELRTRRLAPCTETTPKRKTRKPASRAHAPKRSARPKKTRTTTPKAADTSSSDSDRLRQRSRTKQSRGARKTITSSSSDDSFAEAPETRAPKAADTVEEPELPAPTTPDLCVPEYAAHSLSPTWDKLQRRRLQASRSPSSSPTPLHPDLSSSPSAQDAQQIESKLGSLQEVVPPLAEDEAEDPAVEDEGPEEDEVEPEVMTIDVEGDALDGLEDMYDLEDDGDLDDSLDSLSPTPPETNRHYCRRCGIAVASVAAGDAHWAELHATPPSLERLGVEVDVEETQRRMRRLGMGPRGRWTCGLCPMESESRTELEEHRLRLHYPPQRCCARVFRTHLAFDRHTTKAHHAVLID